MGEKGSPSSWPPKYLIGPSLRAPRASVDLLNFEKMKKRSKTTGASHARQIAVGLAPKCKSIIPVSWALVDLKQTNEH